MSSGNSRFRPKAKRRCDYCGSKKVVETFSWGMTDKFYELVGQTPPAKKGMITESFCRSCLARYGPQQGRFAGH